MSLRHRDGLPPLILAAATTVTTVVAATAVWVVWKKKNRRPYSMRRGKNVIALLPEETSPIMMNVATSISTVTFYVGNHQAAAEFLRQRVAEIVEANPWLIGYLEDNKQSSEGPVVLVYDDDKLDNNSSLSLGQVFAHLKPCVISLGRETPYDAMARLLLPVLVKNGSDSLRARQEVEPQFKVTVIPDSKYPDERWALVVSFSHVLADGHTFYKVHNMLSENERVVRLTAQRKPKVLQAAQQAMGDADNSGFLQRPKPGLLLRLAASTLAGKVFGPPCSVAVYSVDEAFVSRQKAAAKLEKDGSTTEFVSTNDIITSTICRATKCDLGTMDINFRGRLSGCGLKDTDAGNYEDKIVYLPKDFALPSLIRRSILSNQELKRASKPATVLPTSLVDFWRLNMITSVSNWSTFARDVCLEESCGSRADLHLPLFDPGVVPARMFTGCFVFRAGPGAPLGLALAGKADILKAVAESGLVLRGHAGVTTNSTIENGVQKSD